MAISCSFCFFFFLSLLIACSTGRSNVFTLSSKLIHRFSDEARAARVSENGGGFSGIWPRKKSVDYARLLRRNDLQRQRMKLGPQFKSLFFTEGSETFQLGNDYGWLHYTWIDIGTPNISFLVALDVGSDLSWVPCDCIQCAPLSGAQYSRLGRDLEMYSPARSSTSKHLLCSNELCDLGSKCKSQKQPCPYIVNYFTENTSSSGLLIEDTLYLSSGDGFASPRSMQASVIIGCGRMQSGGILTGSAPDGLLGLGFGDISVPSLLAKGGLVRNSFSMCFHEDGSGRIFFGDQGISTQQSTPFLAVEGKYETYIVGVENFCVGTVCLTQTGSEMLFDSGSSFTFLQDNVYQRVVAEFDRQMNASRTAFEDSFWEYCYKARSSKLPEIPKVTLMLAVNKSLVVQDPLFPYHDDEGVLIGFCLALEPAGDSLGSIGQNFMTGYRLVYDRENLKLGWSPSDCSEPVENNGDRSASPNASARGKPENPLPTNQQQSSSSGHAVSPAIAGRTPLSDHSANAPKVVSQFCLLLLLLLLVSFG